MRAKSGERADQRALEQLCALHKVELQDKVEWNQVKLEFQNKLQVGAQVSRKVETGRNPVSKVKVFM